ncbi:quinone oxidoreductase family protein [Pseudonocardia xinjiangensis]|uniref:quinone oxidoreductase family protein n=1 Tax=Pseudonocardia xinjiangensis TaxID=75289 RepID=UPI003D94BD1E
MTTRIVATAFGGPEVLAAVDADVPTPGDGEVTIEVRAAAINPVDYKRFSGAMGADPSLLPLAVGNELAGVVTAVGPSATGRDGALAVGDEVIAYPAPGAYAAAITLPAANVVHKPAQLPWAEASGIMLTGATAVHTLTVVGVTAGDTVLIHGGSGGVGQLAVQLAVAAGATVVTTASAQHDDLLRSYGAIPLRYGPGLADRVRDVAPSGVDAAIDTVGTAEAVDVSLELVADRARIVSIAAFGRADTEIKLVGGAPGADPGTEIRRNAWQQLLPAAAAGTLRVVVARTFPLTDAEAAVRLVADGHAGGKVVLLP